MACSCRSGPLRLFVQGMSRLHITETAATRLPLRPAVARTHKPFQTIRQNQFSTTPLVRLQDSVPVPESKNKKRKRKRYEEGATAAKEVTEASANRRTRKPARAVEAANNDAAPGAPLQEARPWREKGASTTKRTRKPAKAAEAADKDAAPAEARPKREKEPWMIQKEALKQKFPEGWKPLKRLSPDAIAGIRALNAQFPEEYTTRQLSNMFEVSPEAVRRILRSRWRAAPEEEQSRQERWFRRGVSVWSRFAELGVKPPQKWRREGVVRDPSFHENRKAAIERRKQRETRVEAEVEEDKGEKLQRKLGDSIL